MKKKDKTETQAKTETQDVKSAKSGKKVVLTIFNVFINVLIVVVLIISIVVATLALTSKADPDGMPNVFGYTLQYVQSPSMDVPSPDGYEGGCFTTEDVIIGRKYTTNEFPELEVGDIITYNSHDKDDDGNERLITHRIVDKKQLEDGSYVYQTWGDNREVSNVPDQQTIDKYLKNVDIVAVNYTDQYKGKTLKGFAGFFRTLRSQMGFFLIVLIPMIIFFLYAIIRVVISAMNYRKDKTEEEKKEAVDAAVAAALAAKDEDKKEKEASEDKEDKPAAPADMTPDQMEQFKQFLAMQEAQKSEEEKAAEEEKTDEE